MEAATIESPPDAPAVFISRYPNLRVTVSPAQEQLTDVHNRVIRPHDPGLHAQFEKGVFSTTNEAVIEGLIANPNFERDYWLQGRAPDEPKPSIAEQVTRISEAAASGDRSEIEAVIAIEEETHNREAVLLAAQGAMRVLAETDE